MRRRPTRALLRGMVALPAALVCCAQATQAAESPFTVAANLSVGWEDNIALIADEEDKIDAAVTRFGLNLGYQLAQTTTYQLEASLTPFYEWVSDVEDLSSYGATVGLALRGAFASDFTAPWYSIGLDYTIARFKDSDPRDGDWIEAELALGKRFTPSFGIHGGYRYQQRWQQDDDPECVTGGCAPQFNWLIDEVFDLERHGVFLHADLMPVESTNVFLEYSFWNGDVGVAGRGAVPDVAVVDDLALEGYDGNPGIFRVWRAEADQHVAELGVSRQLTDRVSAEVSAMYLWTSDVDNEISEDDYENTVVTFSLTFEI